MNIMHHKEFIFTSLDNFRANNNNPERQRDAAKEFGIRIINDNGLTKSDYYVVKGPFWRFRRRVDSLIRGIDDDCSFFIRKVYATEGSNLKLYYYDLKTQTDAIVEIVRRPGLHLLLRSGREGDLHLELDIMCDRDYHLHFLSLGDQFVVE